MLRKIEEDQEQEKKSVEKISLFNPLQTSKNTGLKIESKEVKIEPKKVNEENEGDSLSTRQEFQRLYNCLEIQPFSQFVLAEKNKNNLDIIKLRMN